MGMPWMTAFAHSRRTAPGPSAAVSDRSAGQPGGTPSFDDRIGALWWLIWLGVLLVLSGTISVSHGADAMWDLKNYHLYNPFEAHHGRYATDVAPAQVQSYLNPLLDYPFYFAVSAFNDHPRTIAFCMGLPQGLNLWLVSLLAWSLSSGQARAVRIALTGLATAIGGTGAGTLPLVGSTTGDVMVAVPTLAALVVLLRAAEQADRPRAGPFRSLLLAGVLSGVAVGAKPTMACYTVGLLATLPIIVPFRQLLRAVVGFGIAAGVGALAAGGYHAIRMFRLFGSPLFPLFNDLLRSPFFEPAAPKDAKFIPKTLGEALYYPFGWATDATRTFVSEVPFRDIRVALELSLVATVAATAAYAALARRDDGRALPRAAAALFAFVVVSYAVWLPMFAVYRYLLPLEMLSGALVLAAALYLARASAVPPLMVAAAVSCWATTKPLEWGHAAFRDRYVEVQAPALAPNTLVLIVGDDPVSYLVPFMDPSARWLSLDNNFLNPTQGNRLVERERDTIAAHRGPMAVLAEGAAGDRVSSTLSAYGLSPDLAACGKVTSSLGGQVFDLCAVRRGS